MNDIFEFEDKARVERLVGTLHDPAATPGDVLTVQADGTVAAAPGGGSMPVQAHYAGAAPITVADSGFGYLPFDTLVAGVDLLDRTDPANPIVLADGWYTLSALVNCTQALTPGGYVSLQTGTSAGVGTGGATTLTDQPISGAFVLCVFQATAGDVLNVFISNNDGAASRDFNLNGAVLTKLA